MAQNPPHFDAVISVQTGKVGEDGRSLYRQTRIGVVFKDDRSTKEHITMLSDVFPHPIQLWERTKESADGAPQAPQDGGDVDLDAPPY